MTFRMRGSSTPSRQAAFRTPWPSRSRSIRPAAPSVRSTKGASASRTEFFAAARTSSAAGLPARGWPGRFRARPRTAASRPRPIATSSVRWHGSIAIPENPASPRIRWTRASEANANGPGSSGPCGGSFGTCLPDRLQRRHHPRIFARLAPAGESQPPRRLQRPCAYWRRKARARRRTSRRTATPEDRSWRDRTGTPWHPASTKSTGKPGGATCRARASIGAEMSMPSTWPAGPVRCASAMVVEPQPQPTSTTRSPALTLARSIRISETGASKTSCTACRSVQRWPAGPFQ